MTELNLELKIAKLTKAYIKAKKEHNLCSINISHSFEDVLDLLTEKLKLAEAKLLVECIKLYGGLD